jgi:hypothetical protein
MLIELFFWSSVITTICVLLYRHTENKLRNVESYTDIDRSPYPHITDKQKN